jgi:hypothetical protein
VSAAIQEQLAGLFFAYNEQFFEGIDEEIEFTHSWKADDDQIFYIADNQDAEQVSEMLLGGALDFDPIDPNNFENQNVRALLFAPADDGNFLIQYFYASQHLTRRGFTLFFDGDTFTRFEGSGFSVGRKIDGSYQNGRLKFKNFNIIKRVFNVLGNYTEASDAQVEEFANLDSVHVENIDAFKVILNQTTRRLISAISAEKTLEDIAVGDIVDSAARVGLEIVVADGRIVLPTNKADLKHILRFLDHGVYTSPILEGRRFIANSKRQF